MCWKHGCLCFYTCLATASMECEAARHAVLSPEGASRLLYVMNGCPCSCPFHTYPSTPP
jgi:hypothetical protein